MSEFARIAVDTRNPLDLRGSKHVFTWHGQAADGGVVRRELRRGRFLPFFEDVAPVEVVMEACGGSHHWARELQALGHTVRLIPAQYVKPFVRRGKNDAADAEAICTAAAQPGITAVPVKSAEQQGGAMPLKVRELLTRSRTQRVNALRGHAAEFGCAQAQGARGLAAVRNELATAPDAGVPAQAKEAFALLGAEIGRLDARLAAVDATPMREHKADPNSRRLGTVPGIGPLGALTLTRLVNPGQFRSGRHVEPRGSPDFAAWLGLVPRERSTGGKQRLGGISRAGNERLRFLLVLGATAVLRHARPGQPDLHAWLEALLKRKPRKLAAVALANKVARTAPRKRPSAFPPLWGRIAARWAMMASGEAYRQPKPAC